MKRSIQHLLLSLMLSAGLCAAAAAEGAVASQAKQGATAVGNVLTRGGKAVVRETKQGVKATGNVLSKGAHKINHGLRRSRSDKQAAPQKPTQK